MLANTQRNGAAIVIRQNPVATGPTSEIRTSNGPNASAQLPSNSAGNANRCGFSACALRPSRAILFAQFVKRERGARGVSALVPLRGVGPNDRLRFILDRQDAVADSEALKGQVHQRARAFVGHQLEM